VNVAVLDFETTGVDTKECRPTEVAVSITDDFFSPIVSYTSLMHSKDYPAISEEVEALTGISNSMVLTEGRHPKDVFQDIAELLVAHDVRYAIAYNAEFDKAVYHEELTRMGLRNTSLGLPLGLQWLCAMKDVQENYKFKCWKLSHLALDHGVAVDPKSLHRATGDVLLTIQMLSKLGTTAMRIAEYNAIPWVALAAQTTEPWKDGGRSTKLAKERGFTWETPRGNQNLKFAKKWVKLVKENEAHLDLGCTLFTVKRIPYEN
jgi:DNA polymerase III epsilon subunit-like protein